MVPVGHRGARALIISAGYSQVACPPAHRAQRSTARPPRAHRLAIERRTQRAAPVPRAPRAAPCTPPCATSKSPYPSPAAPSGPPPARPRGPEPGAARRGLDCPACAPACAGSEREGGRALLRLGRGGSPTSPRGHQRRRPGAMRGVCASCAAACTVRGGRGRSPARTASAGRLVSAAAARGAGMRVDCASGPASRQGPGHPPRRWADSGGREVGWEGTQLPRRGLARPGSLPRAPQGMSTHHLNVSYCPIPPPLAPQPVLAPRAPGRWSLGRGGAAADVGALINFDMCRNPAPGPAGL